MSTYTAVLDGSKTNVEGHSKFLNRLFGPGVATGFNSTALQVVQRGAGANMSVDVNIGDAHLQLPTTAYSFWSWTDSATNVPITAADATNPRIDVIVAWVDTTITTTANNNSPGSLKFQAMTGTPAGTPVAMTDATIQSTLGSTIAWTKLATVAVAANAPNITTANITDLRSGIKPILPIDTPPVDWGVLTTVPSVVSNNGQREHLIRYSGVDYTDRLQAGTKLKIPRTSTVPTQSAQFVAASSQYASKTSPAGITFTDDFTCEAWVYLDSYTSSAVISRIGASQGWQFEVTSAGQVRLDGYNGAYANVRAVQSYQSIPLNKWVHIAATLDMSGFTTATCKTFIDGVDVPASLVQGGTNPTSLVQEGNLQISSYNGATNAPINGKVAHARLWSTVRTAAQIRDNANKLLVGNETGLVGSWKLNGDWTDQTANANTLTPAGGAIATYADNPFKATEYAIATNVVYTGGNTDVTIFSGPRCIPNETLGTTSYSSVATPFGFPAFGNTLATVKVPNYVTTSTNVDADLSGLTATVTVPADRPALRIKIGSLIYSTAGGDNALISLYEDGVAIERIAKIANGNSFYDWFVYEFTPRNATAGSHTYKIMVQRQAGTGTMRIGGEGGTLAPVSQAYLKIEKEV